MSGSRFAWTMEPSTGRPIRAAAQTLSLDLASVRELAAVAQHAPWHESPERRSVESKREDVEAQRR